MNDDLVLHAPMSGWAAPLDEVPDPVFAGRMLGDGVALDPVSESLHAPCDGVVALLPKTGHAVTLRADNGAEILLHVGLETVALGGEGFTAHVAEGQRVRLGERLLSFDLDLLAGRAKSLRTPMVITNDRGFEVVERVTGREVAQGEPLMTLRATGSIASATAAQAEGDVVEADLTVGLAHGLHARPAARLAACAQGFDAQVEVSTGARRANLRSAVSVMALGAGPGRTLHVIARGPAARDAVAALEALLTAMALEEPAQVPPQAAPAPATGREEPAPGVLRGVTAAPGLAIGVAVRLSAPEPVVNEVSAGAAAEARALADALAQVDAQLRAPASGGSGGDILAAHQAFLADPELRAAAEQAIGAGASAGIAWRGAVRAMAETLRGLDDPLFAERADDLLDLERQVLFALSGETAPTQRLPAGAIVVADELLPSQLIALVGVPVAGFCTARGGATSHVAVLAAARGAPALAAMGPELLRVADGTALILDADAGLLRVAPDRATFEAAQGELARRGARRQAERAPALELCRMADGVRVDVFANLGAVAEAAAALAEGAEGCGLFRTELLYLDRTEPPGEDEQAAVYQAMAQALQGRPLVVRTLDAGGDKPLAFLPTPPEANPALGLRGIRAGLRQPDLLATQFRAILRVAGPGERRILLPMVCDLADLRAARRLLDAAAADVPNAAPVRLGVMVETPAAALLADQLADEADFLSIGTNDLAQYVLAIDREHPELAGRLDAMHPAVLRLIAQTAERAAARDCPVSVCGGLASDPLAAPLLVGLGVRGLSAASTAIPAVKAQLRARTLPDCQAAARLALDLTSADEVRALLRERFPRPDGDTP